MVPEGFCVTTEAYKKVVAPNVEFNKLLDQLALLPIMEREEIGEISAEIRQIIEETAISKEIEEEIIGYIAKLGKDHAYAVRSSATAEDLPQASFAGQQDTYLNIIGTDSIIAHIRKCWASLFTDRAVIYRLQNGFDHRKVYISVVVQQMIFPQTYFLRYSNLR